MTNQEITYGFTIYQDSEKIHLNSESLEDAKVTYRRIKADKVVFSITKYVGLTGDEISEHFFNSEIGRVI